MAGQYVENMRPRLFVRWRRSARANGRQFNTVGAIAEFGWHNGFIAGFLDEQASERYPVDIVCVPSDRRRVFGRWLGSRIGSFIHAWFSGIAGVGAPHGEVFRGNLLEVMKPLYSAWNS